MSNEPGGAVLALFDTLINNVKQARPVRSDNSLLGGGVVYSMMTLGMPVDPEDYLHPWSPMGGASAQGQTQGAPTTPAAGGAQPPTQPDPKYAKALEAAYKTAQLCNIMLQVTTDGSYLEYPTGRHLDAAYEGVITGMQPLPMPPISAAVQKQIDDAQKVLYELDPDDGSIVGKSKLYKRYEKNASAYAQAKADFAIAQAAAKSDPAKAEIWPMTSAPYQRNVDDAYDTLKTEGAEKVERALDIIGSVGVSLQDHMIKKARQLFDVYNLGLAGVPAPIPYAFIEPSGWCDPDNDDEGWQQLSVTSKDYQHYDVAHATASGQYGWANNRSSTSGSGGAIIGFFCGGGGGGSSSGDAQHNTSQQAHATNMFRNTATELEISLEYALCTINRPGMISDLFYMQNWYMVGQRKNSISDGTEENQANISDISKLPFLPMIPQQMLVVRNVVISSKNWGQDGETLKSCFSGEQDSNSFNSVSGSASFGFLCLGGSGSHSEDHARGQGSNWQSDHSASHLGTTFDGQTLKIPGAQIIAFLSDIVPACPPLDDPTLPKPKDDKAKVSADTLQPATA
jgi:hypothetical protein